MTTIEVVARLGHMEAVSWIKYCPNERHGSVQQRSHAVTKRNSEHCQTYKPLVAAIHPDQGHQLIFRAQLPSPQLN